MEEDRLRPVRPNPEDPAARLPTAPLFVLHINDSTDDQVLFQAACKKANVPFEWQVAESAEQGIAYLRSLVNLGGKQKVRWPDLVLLDLVMPDESGFKVLEYIRGSVELRMLPVAILTGNATSSVIEHAYELGANAFHEKPVSFQEMVNLVKALYSAWTNARRPTL